MTMLKLVTFFNWIVIIVSGVIFVVLTLFPSKGGDAATKGLGDAFRYLALFIMLIVLVLNILPWTWTRYVGFVLVIIPIFLLLIQPQIRQMQRKAAIKREAARPIFDDPNLDQAARLIRNADTSGVKKWIAANPELPSREGELLGFAISEAAYALHHQKDFLRNVEFLFEAGATLKITEAPDESPVFIVACSGGNPELIQYLIQKGADPNSRDIYYNRPAILSASTSNRDPNRCVWILLESGADPEAIFMNHSNNKQTSILWNLCYEGNWKIAQILIEFGANPDFEADGITPRSMILEYAQNPDYSKPKELMEMAALLK